MMTDFMIKNKTPLKGLFMMINFNVTSTIPELPDFDLEFDDLDYGDPIPFADTTPGGPKGSFAIPIWIENEDGSGQWSDGWKSEDIGKLDELPQDDD